MFYGRFDLSKEIFCVRLNRLIRRFVLETYFSCNVRSPFICDCVSISPVCHTLYLPRICQQIHEFSRKNIYILSLYVYMSHTHGMILHWFRMIWAQRKDRRTQILNQNPYMQKLKKKLKTTDTYRPKTATTTTATKRKRSVCTTHTTPTTQLA